MSSNEDQLRGYFHAYERGDVDGSLEYMTDDIVYIDHAMGFKATNKAYLRRAWNRYFEVASNEDHSSEVHSLHLTPTGEYFVEWTERTRLDRDWAFLRATGTPYAVRGVSTGLMQDGLIVHNSDYYDLTSILRQSGIDEVPKSIPTLEL